MQRISYFLQKINPHVSLKLSITVDNSDPIPSKRSINHFIYNGSPYTNISIYPKLLIDIKEMGADKKTFSVNNFISLSPLTAFRFCRVGNEVIKSYITKEDLFIYEGNRLVLNNEVAKTITKPFPADGKMILFQPIVVQDYTKGIECEGVAMMINEMSNFAIMTFEEFTFLLDTVRKLDFNTMGMELLKIYLLERSSSPG